MIIKILKLIMNKIKNIRGGYRETLRFLLLLHRPSYIQKLNNFCLQRRNGSWPRLI